MNWIQKNRGRELIEAIRFNNEKKLKRLLEKKIDIEIKDERTGNTPLLEAVYVNNRLAVDTLISLEADINAQNKIGSTALTIAVANLYDDIVFLLLKSGIDVSIKNKHGNALSSFVRYNNLNTIKEKEKKVLGWLLKAKTPTDDKIYGEDIVYFLTESYLKVCEDHLNCFSEEQIKIIKQKRMENLFRKKA